MKIKRSERVVDMTYYLLANPHTLIPLTYFAQRYESAKSSISEDLNIVKKTFEEQGVGRIETLTGSTGGVVFVPKMFRSQAAEFVHEMKEKLEDSSRLLPGGYIYLSDLLSDPVVLRKLGKMIASAYEGQQIDVIMTVATKGVPIAQAVADQLNVPFVIVRRDSKITEGSTVSINYVSGSSSRVEKMELSKRSLPSGSRVLIVDDFLKSGGTVEGLRSLIAEFNATAVAAVAFCASKQSDQQEGCSAILTIDEIDTQTGAICASVGDFLDKHQFLSPL